VDSKRSLPCELFRAATRSIYFRGRARIAKKLATLFLPNGYHFHRLSNGKVLLLDAHDYFQGCMYFGIYQPEIALLLSDFLTEGDIFFDVGANIGYFTCIASALVGPTGEVHSFEPDPRSFDLLQQTVNANQDREHVFPNQVAVSDRLGSLQFNMVDQIGWSNVLPNTQHAIQNTIKVPAISLDDYVREKNIDPARIKLIKIDVEGWEPYALQGMKNILSSSSPSIICEYNTVGLPAIGFQLEDIKKLMSSHHFEGYAIQEWWMNPAKSSVQILTGKKISALPLQNVNQLDDCDLLFLKGTTPRHLRIIETR